MSLPPLIRDAGLTELDWRRKVRDAVNALIASTRGTGTTAERPLRPTTGDTYFDTTLGFRIDWDGAAWVDGTGASV